jgi:signal transduction histidine kinase
MRHGWASDARGGTAGDGPSDRALGRLTGWYAVALRAGSAVIYAVVGPLAATQGVSAGWLGAVLVTLCLWSAFFAWRVWRAGLTGPLALADAAVIAVLLAGQRHVVPSTLTADGTTWMLPLASTSVFILQMTLRPALGLPAAGAVAAVYVGTVPQPADAWILVLQAVVTAALMTLLRNAGRGADAVIEAAFRGEQEMRAEAARRADEREQHRQLHDTILSTLTMVASGTFAGRSEVLSAQAGRDLDVLRELRAMPGDAPAGAADLSARIGSLAAAAAPLTVRLVPAPVSLPGAVAEHIAGSVAEALRNVSRHAGVAEADVTIRGGDGWVTVEVTDQGAGFDPAVVPPWRRGVRESIAGRMSAVGGAATVTSRPGTGTTVVLRWPG